MGDVPVNTELVRGRAADIRREAEVLRGYAALPVETFSLDPEKLRAARYSIVVIVEGAAAICNHLVSRRGKVPDSYPGCFEMMAEAGILDSGLAGRMSALARLRNILVHGYGRIDDRRIHASLREGLPDLDEFERQVFSYLTRTGGTGGL
jgi:uncharacterized protein YutE (UPF0331/DUF86 family)